MSELATLPDLAGRINAEHAACMAAAQDAVARAIEVGRLLAEAKSQLRHGDWSRWVAEHCRFDLRQAQKYMRAHRNRDTLLEQMRIPNSLSSLDGVMAMLAEPRPEDRSPLSDAERAELAWCEAVIDETYARLKAAGLTWDDYWLLMLDDLARALESPDWLLNETGMAALRNLLRSMLEEMESPDWPPGETMEAKLRYARSVSHFAARLQNAATEHKIRAERELGKLLGAAGAVPKPE